jgi:hypothetical protein
MANVEYLPGALDIKIYQGDTVMIPLTFRDSDGNPIDLTGITFESQIRRAPADEEATPLISMDCNVPEPTSGRVLISLSSEQTTLLDNLYVYDLQATNGSVVRTYLSGTISVVKEVTR